jgi:hypothetical protein
MSSLEYHGQLMKADPINISIPDLMQYMVRGLPARVVIEPGDATRYEWLICPHHAGGFYIVNLGRAADGEGDVQGHFVGHPGQLNYLAEKIAGPNKWSQTFLTWWVSEVLFADETR